MKDARFSILKVLQHAILPLLIAAGGVFGFMFLASLKAAPGREHRETPSPLVETILVEPAPKDFHIRVHGTVHPKTIVTLGAEVGGRVVEKAAVCDTGNFVKQGTPLFLIDPRTYELEIKRLESEVKQCELDLVQLDIEESNTNNLIEVASTEFDISKRELDRVERLASRNAASQSERDQGQTQLMKTKNALMTLQNQQRLISARRDRLKAQLELTSSKLELAKLDLEKTRVVAPIDGVITQEFAEANSFVQPGSQLVEIRDSRSVEVRCNLRIDELSWLWDSMPARREANLTQEMIHQAPQVPAQITYRMNGQEYKWTGGLSRYVGEGLDEKTRTIPCLVEVKNPIREEHFDGPPVLIPGMFVQVDLMATPQAPLLKIPYAALRPDEKVWAVNEGQLQVRKIDVVKIYPDYVLIDPHGGTLQVGDKIVVSPLSVAEDGMKVREQPLL